MEAEEEEIDETYQLLERYPAVEHLISALFQECGGLRSARGAADGPRCGPYFMHGVAFKTSQVRGGQVHRFRDMVASQNPAIVVLSRSIEFPGAYRQR